MAIVPKMGPSFGTPLLRPLACYWEPRTYLGFETGPQNRSHVWSPLKSATHALAYTRASISRPEPFKSGFIFGSQTDAFAKQSFFCFLWAPRRSLSENWVPKWAPKLTPYRLPPPPSPPRGSLLGGFSPNTSFHTPLGGAAALKIFQS